MSATNRLYSRKWKLIIKQNNEITANLITHDHHLMRASKVKILDKLTLTKLYSILILKVQNKPFCKIYFEKLFNDNDID